MLTMHVLYRLSYLGSHQPEERYFYPILLAIGNQKMTSYSDSPPTTCQIALGGAATG
jgi:hypothetical protein